jgi:hypothetical protein
MKEFAIDVKNLVEKHWKQLIVIAIVVSMLSNYRDIKQGFVDGYNSVQER